MVYVGQTAYKYKRMHMFHMVADSLQELHEMADKIGVARRHFQNKAGKPHYDICRSRRNLAISLGAKSVPDKEIVLILKKTYNYQRSPYFKEIMKCLSKGSHKKITVIKGQTPGPSCRLVGKVTKNDWEKPVIDFDNSKVFVSKKIRKNLLGGVIKPTNKQL